MIEASISTPAVLGQRRAAAPRLKTGDRPRDCAPPPRRRRAPGPPAASTAQPGAHGRAHPEAPGSSAVRRRPRRAPPWNDDRGHATAVRAARRRPMASWQSPWAQSGPPCKARRRWSGLNARIVALPAAWRRRPRRATARRRPPRRPPSVRGPAANWGPGPLPGFGDPNGRGCCCGRGSGAGQAHGRANRTWPHVHRRPAAATGLFRGAPPRGVRQISRPSAQRRRWPAAARPPTITATIPLCARRPTSPLPNRDPGPAVRILLDELRLLDRCARRSSAWDASAGRPICAPAARWARRPPARAPPRVCARCRQRPRRTASRLLALLPPEPAEHLHRQASRRPMAAIRLRRRPGGLLAKDR